MKMHQVYVVRESDNSLTGRAAYRVIQCFEVDVNLEDGFYGGRRVWRTGFRTIPHGDCFRPGCVLFSSQHQSPGTYISIRAALGIKKAGRA